MDELTRQRILAIVRSDDANGCFHAAMTLIEEGVNLVEVSLSGHDAVDVITRVRNAAPDALVGAGTVLTREDAQAVYESGALFVVTPGLAPSVAAAGEIGTTGAVRSPHPHGGDRGDGARGDGGEGVSGLRMGTGLHRGSPSALPGHAVGGRRWRCHRRHRRIPRRRRCCRRTWHPPSRGHREERRPRGAAASGEGRSLRNSSGRSMTRMDVVTMGEAMMALRWSESMALGRPAQTSIAGAESNVAICLARLEHSVSFVGRVGDDQPGELVMRTLRAERVGTEHVLRDADAGTGVILFDRPVAGSVNVTYRRRGSAGSRLRPADIAAALGTHRESSMSPESRSRSVTLRRGGDEGLDTAREAGCLDLDVNYRATLWSPEAATAATAGLRPSTSRWARRPNSPSWRESRRAPPQATRKLLAAGVRQVVTKADPCATAHTAEGSSTSRP